MNHCNPRLVTRAFRTSVRASVGLALVAGSLATAGTLIVSGDDGKVARVDGGYRVDPNAVPDVLVVLDGKSFPPRIIAKVAVHHSVAAPPTSIAITPDEKLALLAAPNHIDAGDGTKLRTDSYLQVIKLDGAEPTVFKHIDLAHQPQSVTINKAGTLALTVQNEGELSVFIIRDDDVNLSKTLLIGGEDSHPNGVAFTPDGRWVLVTFRGEDKVAVLQVDGDEVAMPGYYLNTGRNPYVVASAPNGRYAVVGNVSQSKEARQADEDSVTFIDLTTTPFKVVAEPHVPLTPEGVAISPDSKWIAISSINGSNAKNDSPSYHDNGVLTLFFMHHGQPIFVGTAKTGHTSQGVLFTRDSKHILVQDFVEGVLSTYQVTHQGPVDTGIKITVPGRPASIAAAAR